jgi:holo-[acyl-carrier protein] synthase
LRGFSCKETCGRLALALGGAAARLAAMTPPGHAVVIHLTLTDEYPLAQAQVIIEAVAQAHAESICNP